MRNLSFLVNIVDYHFLVLPCAGNREIVDFMSKMYRGDFTYQEFGTLFKAQYFDPVEWATLFAKAGAKYHNHINY